MLWRQLGDVDKQLSKMVFNLRPLSDADEDAYRLLLLPEQQELCASSPWCLLGAGGRAGLGTHTGSWISPSQDRELFLVWLRGFLHAAPRPPWQQMTS